MTRILPWMLALVCLSLFAGLGRWQMERADFKQALLDRQTRVLADRIPVGLADSAEADRAELDWVAGAGEFLDRPALLLDNQIDTGRVGVRVYRLFQPDGSARPVLVELGWLPLAADRRLPETSALPGSWTLSGLMLPPPSPGLRLLRAQQRLDDGRWLLIRLDTTEVAQALDLPDLSPRILRPDPGLALGYERDLDVLSNTLLPEKHRGYAVQWFGLAAATGLVFLILVFRRKRP